MGFELDQFVDPDHISQELICPICCGVLERPVQTSTDHLFCEDELLEWMERSDICPLSNTKLNPAEIKKPSRIIMNILGGLIMKCSNRSEGCAWTGRYEFLQDHLKCCAHRPRAQLCELLELKSAELDDVKKKYSELKARCRYLEDDNAMLKSSNEALQRQIKVYDAFVKSGEENEVEADFAPVPKLVRKLKSDEDLGLSRCRGTERQSDLQVINRLRLLEEKIADSSQKR